MAECNITSVQVLNNPAQFTEPIQLEVQYECLSSLEDDLEWKVVYVGSADDEAYDQVLDSALVGPVHPGTYKFRMEAPAPDPSRIPVKDLVGATVLLLTCHYKAKEFVRVGWYVNVNYTDPAYLEPNVQLPNPPRIDQLQRSIMADHPRVTKFPHDFDNAPAPPPVPEQEPEPEPEDLLADDDEDFDEEEDEGGMLEEEDLEGVENQDPNGAPAATAAGAQLQGKGGIAAAAAAAAGAGADAGAGVEDMEL